MKIIPIKESKIILDTCILQYLNNEQIEPELNQVFLSLKNQNNNFYFSDYSTYEMFSCLPKNKEEDLNEIWKKFLRYGVASRVTRFAVQLSTAYKSKEVPIDSIDDGDKIIGATAILTESIILTANENDFPRPFFDELHITDIFYKTKRGKPNLIRFYFLLPNKEIVMHYFSERKWVFI